MITDRDFNLRLGVAYLKRLLDDFRRFAAMAAAAYNAGPGPAAPLARRALMEPAAWAEPFPFTKPATT
jgi:soluble lytic murein transglycosylase